MAIAVKCHTRNRGNRPISAGLACRYRTRRGPPVLVFAGSELRKGLASGSDSYRDAVTMFPYWTSWTTGFSKDKSYIKNATAGNKARSNRDNFLELSIRPLSVRENERCCTDPPLGLEQFFLSIRVVRPFMTAIPDCVLTTDWRSRCDDICQDEVRYDYRLLFQIHE